MDLDHDLDHDPDEDEEVWAPRSNDIEGEACSSCGEELEHDSAERMVYCVNDWAHG